MGRMTKLTAAAASALLVLGAAACGDDDDDEGTTATTEASGSPSAPAEGDLTAFCDGLIEFNGLVTQTDFEGAPEEDIVAQGEELVPVWDQVAENAPDAAQGAIDELDPVLQALLEGDASEFDSDATFETYTEVVTVANDECGFETIDVTGVDYAFEGVPATIPAGSTSFAFTNASESEEHEMIIVRKADGVDLTFDEILNLSEEESESMVEPAAFAFAPPGGETGALVELTPGEWIMVCFIPVGGAEDGPPHFTQGMKQEFTVE